MSRLGVKPIAIPTGVKVNFSGNVITVAGANGTLKQVVHPYIKIEIADSTILVKRSSNATAHRSLHGTTRTLILNMVKGVQSKFEKKLQIDGVGFKAEVKEKKLIMQLGFVHPVIIDIPDGITAAVDKQMLVAISGSDKQLVGEIAAKIRRVQPAEPYKGKGIKYIDEIIRRKVGKAAATSTGGKGK